MSSNLNSEDCGIELYYDEETAEELEAIAEQNCRYQAGLPVTPTPRKLKVMEEFKEQEEEIK